MTRKSFFKKYFTRHKEILINISLLVLVLFVCFIFLEFALWLTMPSSVSGSESKETYIVPSSDPALVYENNAGYHLLVENHRGVEGRTIEFTINSRGLRGKIEYPVNKVDGDVRIIALGDSVTFGTRVGDNGTYPFFMESLLNNRRSNHSFSVLNFGVTGYDTLQEVHLLEQRGLMYHPDVVVLGYVLNDPVTTPVDSGIFDSREDQWCRVPFIEISIPCRLYDTLFSLRTVQFFSSKFAALYLSNVDYYKQIHNDPVMWGEVVDSFSRLKRLGEEHNFTVVVVQFPQFENFEAYPYVDIHSRVRSLSEQNGFYYLDLYDEFKDEDPHLFWQPIGNSLHPIESGYERIAQAVVGFLESHSLLPVS